MVHLALHSLIPALVARVVDPVRWLSATLLMLGTMLVDFDHLVAELIIRWRRSRKIPAY
ncbi:MAG: DUF6122 family protein [Longimicrobiales bacterium]|jgi:hypothetical protein